MAKRAKRTSPSPSGLGCLELLISFGVRAMDEQLSCLRKREQAAGLFDPTK